MAAHNLAPIYIFSPETSDARMKTIDGVSKGFIYCLARKGVTGKNTDFTQDMADYLEPGHGFELKDGFLKIPRGPGLGIRVNEEFVRKQAEIGHRWRAPVWRHEDGSIAEW